MAEKETRIILGLGNPGAKYAHTRHNVGWLVTEELCRRWGLSLIRKKFDGVYAETEIAGKRVVVCQPLTYMNLSGRCARQLLHWYKASPEQLLVICDDVDLPTGKLRLRGKGSAGTHNGLRSLVQELNSQDFARLRVGVGGAPGDRDLADWVLSGFGEDRDTMNAAFSLAADAAEDWVRSGIDHAMNTYNKK